MANARRMESLYSLIPKQTHGHHQCQRKRLLNRSETAGTHALCAGGQSYRTRSHQDHRHRSEYFRINPHHPHRDEVRYQRTTKGLHQCP